MGLTRLLTALAFLVATSALTASAQEEGLDTEHGEELFAQIDEMVAEIGEITGLELSRPILRSIITREKIRELVERRLEEEASPEEIRAEEVFLKMFGFVGDEFNLAEQFVEVLTEQATALYDYKDKQLYLATWTPLELQEAALVHELAHAVADQNFNLGKYVNGSKGADADLARTAVLEGQASWIMTEYVLRQSGKSMLDTPLLASVTASASRFEAGQYPRFASAPFYLRESMLFPYTEGLLFQQAVLEKRGKAGFAELYRKPPVSSQQILNPEAYFERQKPRKPRLPKAKLDRGYKLISKGEVGQLDHAILLKQYIGEGEAETLSPRWRGGRYKILERKKSPRERVLLYAVEWDTAENARRYFNSYQKICRRKWKPEDNRNTSTRAAGRGGKASFDIMLDGTRVTSIERLPDDTLSTNHRQVAGAARSLKEAANPHE